MDRIKNHSLTFAFFLFLLISFKSFAGISIISDLDDTIKITNVSSAYQATVNGIFKKNVFTGMPEFLAEARNYSEELNVLTASPSLIHLSVKRTLGRNGIKFERLFLRNILRDRNSYRYKVNNIKRLIENSEHDFILIGDDANHDPEVYDEIVKLYPNRILSVYIHVIQGRDLPESSTAYFTSADLALREFLAGRMDLESTRKVLSRVLSENRLWFIRPAFSVCPQDESVWLWHGETDLVHEIQPFTERLLHYCTAESQVIPALAPAPL